MDLQEVARIAEGFNRLAQRLDTAAKYIDGLVEQNRAQIDRSLEQIDRVTSGARFNRVTEYLESFERATADLDRGQLSRVNEVIAGFEEYTVHDEAHRARSRPGRFITLIAPRRRASSPFEEYLRRAHEHPAVARKEGGRRRWFEAWRRHALLLVSYGYGSQRLRAVVGTASPPKRESVAVWPPRRSAAIDRRFRERLLNVIFPIGPNAVFLPSRPILGGGLTAHNG